MRFFKFNYKTILLAILLVGFTATSFSSCTRAKAKCKKDAKKARKNNVGWRN